MAKIRPLPRDVIQAIAAGEIVEKPSIVVKELIENSLDAHATQIDVLVENGGLDRITVSDDGDGMDETDILLSFQRHTTSKIHELHHLTQIHTLGFRGEALASIASASRLTLQSRSPQAEVGQRVVVEQEQVLEVTPVGMPIGTVITVEALFHHLPARRKFLRKPLAEFRDVLEVVTRSALSHPNVGFSLTHNKKVLFRLPAQQNFAERVHTLLGNDIKERILPVTTTNEQLRFSLHGVVGNPQTARRSTQKQYLFVNGRPVHHPPFSTTVAQSFGSLIEPRAYPIFVLNLTLPPDQVDINIHPRKETLKFLNEKTVLEFVENAVTQTLANHDLTYRYGQTEPGMDRTASVYTAQTLKSIVEPWLLSPHPTLPEIVQLHKTYLLTQTSKGFVLIDQHAAHERILYEQFLTAFHSSTEKAAAAVLRSPQQMSFSVAETQILENHLETFRSLGFEIEKFGETSFKVTHAPLLFHDRDFQQLFQEIIDDLETGKPVKLADSVALRTIAYLACRQAVKAGDVLTAEQRRQLVEKLAETPNNTNCPHGRPTTITFSVHDLEVMFKRK